MTGAARFVSDVHLNPAAPAKSERFARFLEATRREACALYVLGDLFDWWIGPRQRDLPDFAGTVAALARAAAAGSPVAFLPGNRDFLFPGGGAPDGVRLLGDRARVRIQGKELLLTHGDLLCTADRRYQRWRRVARSSLLRAAARHAPAALLRRAALALRAGRRREIARKSPSEMGITARGVRVAFAGGADAVVCGHVHRQEARPVPLGERTGWLYVLGAWEGGGAGGNAPYLELREGAFAFRTFEQ